jgi:hypothetical protein
LFWCFKFGACTIVFGAAIIYFNGEKIICRLNMGKNTPTVVSVISEDFLSFSTLKLIGKFGVIKHNNHY